MDPGVVATHPGLYLRGDSQGYALSTGKRLATKALHCHSKTRDDDKDSLGHLPVALLSSLARMSRAPPHTCPRECVSYDSLAHFPMRLVLYKLPALILDLQLWWWCTGAGNEDWEVGWLLAGPVPQVYKGSLGSRRQQELGTFPGSWYHGHKADTRGKGGNRSAARIWEYTTPLTHGHTHTHTVFSAPSKTSASTAPLSHMATFTHRLLCAIEHL